MKTFVVARALRVSAPSDANNLVLTSYHQRLQWLVAQRHVQAFKVPETPASAKSSLGTYLVQARSEYLGHQLFLWLEEAEKSFHQFGATPIAGRTVIYYLLSHFHRAFQGYDNDDSLQDIDLEGQYLDLLQVLLITEVCRPCHGSSSVVLQLPSGEASAHFGSRGERIFLWRAQRLTAK
jgi:hypothetical protein